MTIRHAAETQAAFMNACGQKVRQGEPNGYLISLYLELLVEEVRETVDAWNDFLMAQDGGDEEVMIKKMAKVVDGITDVMFVDFGLYNATGTDAQKSWDEVVKSNQSKLGPNPKFREDGKLLKDANFVEPDFERVVRESWAI